MKKLHFGLFAALLFAFTISLSSCSKSSDATEDLAAKVVGSYSGAIYNVTTGAVLVPTYNFSITKVGTGVKEISLNDGTGAVSGFIEKKLSTTTGKEALSGFLSANQGGTNLAIANMTTLSGVKELIAILPELSSTTNNILFDVSGNTIIIGAQSAAGVRSAVVAKRN